MKLYKKIKEQEKKKETCENKFFEFIIFYKKNFLEQD